MFVLRLRSGPWYDRCGFMLWIHWFLQLKKQFALQPSLNPIYPNIVWNNKTQLQKNKIFENKRPPSRVFYVTHILSVASHMCTCARNVNIPTPPQCSVASNMCACARNDILSVASHMCTCARNVNIPTPPQPTPVLRSIKDMFMCKERHPLRSIPHVYMCKER